jgi:large subunit ribosomal protein L10
MPNRVNQLLVKQYKEAFKGAKAVVSIGYPGMGVNDVHAMRGKLGAAGCAMHFVRNRIVCKAFEEMGLPDVKGLCAEQTAFVLGEDVVSLARLLVDMQKEYKALKLHGALVDGSVVKGAAGVVDVSKSPTKEELKSIISGQMLQPARNVSGAALSVGAKLASQIKRIAEKDETKDGAAA